MILHSNILGKGKPFVILHGFLGMSDNWKTLGRKFAENNNSFSPKFYRIINEIPTVLLIGIILIVVFKPL